MLNPLLGFKIYGDIAIKNFAYAKVSEEKLTAYQEVNNKKDIPHEILCIYINEGGIDMVVSTFI